ncbi:MAG: magnesium/cobalt transporter CorA [candidate division Zixibacteria bacterium]|nr:magnesium/cobalt transporter CorA [candidate division Zixibacteria bacterium]
MIRSFIWTPEEGTSVYEGVIDFDKYLSQPDLIMWVDMTAPSDKESYVLTHDFNFHPLAIEDVISEVPRPKIDDYGKYLFLVFQIADYMGKETGLKVSEVDFFLTKNCLVTVHFDDHQVFENLYTRAGKDDRLFFRGADFLFHAVLDSVIDNYTSALDLLEFEVDAVEDDVFEEPDEETVKTIFTLRRDIHHMKRIAQPQQEVLAMITREDYELISEKTSVYLSDILDHMQRINETAESHRDTLKSALDVYYSSVSTRTNEIIKVLTIFTAILMPPTFLVGLYGMNFKYMPEITWKYGYAFFWGLVVIITIALLFFFKKKKWI